MEISLKKENYFVNGTKKSVENQPGTDVMIFKNIFAEKFGKKRRF
jgi:hypothetical protein